VILPYELGTVKISNNFVGTGIIKVTDNPESGINRAINAMAQFKEMVESINLNTEPIIESKPGISPEEARERVTKGFAFIDQLNLSPEAKDRLKQKIAVKEAGI